MLVFLDANVLFSAARNPDGRASALFTIAANGLCTLVSSPHAIEEARRNLHLKQPGALADLQQLIGAMTVCREATPATIAWAEEQGLPAKDAPILAAAVESRAGLLATGDLAHFGHLYGRKLRGVEVGSLATALTRLLPAT